MGWRTKDGTGDADALVDDRLAIYDSTRVPSGRSTGLPRVPLVRWTADDVFAPAPEPPASRSVVDLRDWRVRTIEDEPGVTDADDRREHEARFEPLVFEQVVVAPALSEVIAPDAEPFEPLVFAPEPIEAASAAPLAPDADDAEPVADADRRGAPRYVLRVPAAATFERSDATELGETGDASIDGLLLHMPYEPPDTHLDLVVGDEAHCSLIWAKVVDHRPDPDGGFCWHLAIVSADDAWTALIERSAHTSQPRSA